MFGRRDKTNQTGEKFLLPDAVDYRVYRMSFSEKMLCFLAGAGAGFIVGEVFYGILPISIVFAVIVGVAAVPIWYKHKVQEQGNTLKLQFRDMLESVSTSIGAGQNVTGAFVSAYNDMSMQYSDNALIVKELSYIVGGMQNGINIEDLLQDFALRSGLEDVRSFASVFETAYRTGGNIRSVIQSTYAMINEKMSVELEIQTMTASANAELNMMLVMPVIIILMMRFMGGGMTGQGTPTSIISTTIAIIIFAVSYFVGKRLMAIKL